MLPHPCTSHPPAPSAFSHPSAPNHRQQQARWLCPVPTLLAISAELDTVTPSRNIFLTDLPMCCTQLFLRAPLPHSFPGTYPDCALFAPRGASCALLSSPRLSSSTSICQDCCVTSAWVAPIDRSPDIHQVPTTRHTDRPRMCQSPPTLAGVHCKGIWDPTGKEENGKRRISFCLTNKGRPPVQEEIGSRKETARV